MGNKSGKEKIVPGTSFKDWEIDVLQQLFKNFVQAESRDPRITFLQKPKTFERMLPTYDNFARKFFAWCIYNKTEYAMQSKDKRFFHPTELCFNTFLVSLEALTRSRSTSIYLKEHENVEIFKLVVGIMAMDISNYPERINFDLPALFSRTMAVRFLTLVFVMLMPGTSENDF